MVALAKSYPFWLVDEDLPKSGQALVCSWARTAFWRTKRKLNRDHQRMRRVKGKNKYVQQKVGDDSGSPKSMEDGRGNGDLRRGNSSAWWRSREGDYGGSGEEGQAIL
jgi:hypothetical protein